MKLKMYLLVVVLCFIPAFATKAGAFGCPLTVTVVGSGKVTSSDGFINCPGTCTHTYQSGALANCIDITLTAEETIENWTFKTWGSCTTGGGTSTTCGVATPGGATATATFIEEVGWFDYEPIDWAGDNKSSILLQNSTTGAVDVWLMNGAAVTSPVSVAPLVAPGWQIMGQGFWNPAVPTFAGHKILWQNSTTGAVAVWLMSGTTVTGGGYVANSVAPGWQIMGMGDFNGDGDGDILWQNSETGQVAVWLLNGSAIKSSGYVANSIAPGWQIMGGGDFDGDGKADILLYNLTTGAVAVWLMNGTTIKSGGYVTNSLDPSWQMAEAGDFDGDGKTDILLQNSTTGAVAVWLMNGTAIKSSGYVANSVDPSWDIAKVGDFNGDGKADILWQNEKTGAVAVWLINGTTILSGSGYVTNSLAPGWQIQ